MKNLLRLNIIIIMMMCASSMFAQNTGDANTDTSSTDTGEKGWGGSAIANVGSFYFNGDYSVFSAGVGFGVSYKSETRHKKYPFEFGFYLAPQISSNANGDVAFVSVLFHVTFLKAMGVGLGMKFWNKGEGILKPASNNVFFTIGYGLTNENR